MGPHDLPHRLRGLDRVVERDARVVVVYDVRLDRPVEAVASEPARVAVDGAGGAAEEGPGAGAVEGGRGRGVLEVCDCYYTGSQ